MLNSNYRDMLQVLSGQKVKFLLVGAYSAIEYAVIYGQKNYTPWAPPLAPIKIIMGIGIVLMLLQTIARFFKDLAKYRGEKI